MCKNKLIVSAAGSGKTTYLVKEALKIETERVLITTYTLTNEAEIKKKFVQLNKCIPQNVTVQTWFSFLIQHGVKPYQGTFNALLFNNELNGMILCNGNEGKYPKRINGRTIYLPKAEESHFKEHYFTENFRIYSDRLPKFVVKANLSTNGEIINRISRIFPNIFIDEVQDLAGYDLEILKLLFKSLSKIILVGDPRQVTYLTHHENQYKKYRDGKIKDFIENECKRPIQYKVDDTSLNKTHRNNNCICDFSSKLFDPGEFLPIEPCSCDQCRNYQEDFEGIFFIKPSDVEDYLSTFNPVQLRWDIRKEVNSRYEVYNFGDSKGRTFKRVLIYPTDDMIAWIFDNSSNLAPATRAKFYVAITRARYSVGIVFDYNENTNVEGITNFSFEN